MISSTCSKYKLATKYVDVAVPVISLEGLLADTLHFAGRNRYVDYGEHGEERESDDPPTRYLDIVGAWNPMSAGLAARTGQVHRAGSVLKWAHPTPDAIVIATLPGSPDQARSSAIPPARRWPTDSRAGEARLLPLDNPSYDDMTAQGKALFDAVTLWALGGDQSPAD